MKRQLFLWLSGTAFYRFCLKWIIPAVRFWGHRLPPYTMEYAQKQMRVGDILLLKDKHKLSNILIGGEYSHCGIYMGSGMVAEMSHYNFAMISLANFVSSSTKLAAYRLFPYDRKYAYRMVREVRTQRNAIYDGRFTLGVEALYCSELIYLADVERRMQVDLSDLAGLGQDYVSPDGLASAPGLRKVFFYEV